MSPLPNFQDSRNLYPIGFKSSRVYPSFKTNYEKVEYISEIVESEDKQSPVFTVTASDATEDVIRKVGYYSACGFFHSHHQRSADWF